MEQRVACNLFGAKEALIRDGIYPTLKAIRDCGFDAIEALYPVGENPDYPLPPGFERVSWSAETFAEVMPMLRGLGLEMSSIASWARTFPCPRRRRICSLLPG